MHGVRIRARDVVGDGLSQYVVVPGKLWSQRKGKKGSNGLDQGRDPCAAMTIMIVALTLCPAAPPSRKRSLITVTALELLVSMRNRWGRNLVLSVIGKRSLVADISLKRLVCARDR